MTCGTQRPVAGSSQAADARGLVDDVEDESGDHEEVREDDSGVDEHGGGVGERREAQAQLRGRRSLDGADTARKKGS